MTDLSHSLVNCDDHMWVSGVHVDLTTKGITVIMVMMAVMAIFAFLILMIGIRVGLHGT